MLTAHTVLPFFYILALICLLLGVWLLLTVQSTQEMKVSVKRAAREPSFFVATTRDGAPVQMFILSNKNRERHRGKVCC